MAVPWCVFLILTGAPTLGVVSDITADVMSSRSSRCTGCSSNAMFDAALLQASQFNFTGACAIYANAVKCSKQCYFETSTTNFLLVNYMPDLCNYGKNSLTQCGLFLDNCKRQHLPGAFMPAPDKNTISVCDDLVSFFRCSRQKCSPSTTMLLQLLAPLELGQACCHGTLTAATTDNAIREIQDRNVMLKSDAPSSTTLTNTLMKSLASTSKFVQTSSIARSPLETHNSCRGSTRQLLENALTSLDIKGACSIYKQAHECHILCPAYQDSLNYFMTPFCQLGNSSPSHCGAALDTCRHQNGLTQALVGNMDTPICNNIARFFECSRRVCTTASVNVLATLFCESEFGQACVPLYSSITTHKPDTTEAPYIYPYAKPPDAPGTEKDSDDTIFIASSSAVIAVLVILIVVRGVCKHYRDSKNKSDNRQTPPGQDTTMVFTVQAKA